MPDDQSLPRQGAAPSEAAAPPPAPALAAPDKPRSSRRRLFAILLAIVLAAALGYALYDVLVLSHVVETDDAYVGADVAVITPQVSGQVLEVRVQNTQAVKAGQVLAVIDPADARLQLAQAEADYGRAVRRVQQYLANVERTGIDLHRRQALSASGAVSGEELTTARNAYQTALANLEATKAAGVQAAAARTVAQGELASSQALTSEARTEDNPEVMAAKAAVDTANLALSRTVLRAPFDGVVSQRQVQVGQRIATGAQLMTVVPLDRLYVDANFKEVQLRKVEIGQPVELVADRYGKGVVFHGRVVGLAGGTGAAFALIPAQNATGNWIKVVQRLPVRIALDRRELRDHPLRVGLSMVAKVDIAAHPAATGR